MRKEKTQLKLSWSRLEEVGVCRVTDPNQFKTYVSWLNGNCERIP